MLPASRLVLLRGKVLHPYRQVFGALGVGLELQILSRNQDNRQSCDRTAIPLVFATMKTVLVLVVHLLAIVATHRFASQPAFPDALDSCPHDGLIGFPVPVSLLEIAIPTTRPTSRTPLPN